MTYRIESYRQSNMNFDQCSYSPFHSTPFHINGIDQDTIIQFIIINCQKNERAQSTKQKKYLFKMNLSTSKISLEN